MQLRSLPGELVGQAGLQHETAVKAVDSSVFVSLNVLQGLQAVSQAYFFSISATFTFSKVYANENQRSTTCCRKVRLRTEMNILDRKVFPRPQKCGGSV